MTREEEAIYRLKNMAWLDGSAEREQTIKAIDMAIEALHQKGAYEQTKWERDMALQTLEEHGIGLGQKAEYIIPSGDAELDEMMKDLVEVLHDVEWWQSCDIGEDDYRKTVKAFKAKWFDSDRGERLKPIIDRRINEVRTELINMIGGDSE